MKLALINLEKESTDPPLGLAYLSSYIKKYCKYKNIIIIDKEDILDAVKREKPDIIGIGPTTVEFSKANKLAEELRKISNTIFIVGGIHITIMPEHFKESNFDIAVLGEGEKTLCELFETLTENGINKLENVNGISYRKDGKIIFTKPRELIHNLDEIPFPDRDSLKMKEIYLVPRISAAVDNIGVFTPMFTSRGCPYNCVFCSTKSFWGKTRLNSAEYVVGEIETLVKKYHVEGIHIFDDLFIADKERVKKIVELMEEKGLNKKLSFSLLARTNLVNEELLGYLKRMNVTHIGFGFESGSDRMLKYLKVNSISIEQHKKAVELCKKYGFKVIGSFMIGCPNETKEDVEKTFEFIREAGLTQFNFNQIIPFPRTKIWDYAKENGFVDDSFNFLINKMDSLLVSNFNPNLILSKNYSVEEFKEIFNKAQGLVNKNKQDKIKIRLKYFKYILNYRFVLKLLKRRKRVLSLIRKS